METTLQKKARHRLLVGLLAGLSGLYGLDRYIENTVEYPERTEEMQRILTSVRNERIVPYNVANTITHDDKYHVYVPKSIDGVKILIDQTPSSHYKLIREDSLPYSETLEARVHIPGMFATRFSEDGERLLVEEREIIKRIIADAAKTAKQIGAAALKPEITFHTELTPNHKTGHPNYWNSKTTIVGRILYYG